VEGITTLALILTLIILSSILASKAIVKTVEIILEIFKVKVRVKIKLKTGEEVFSDIEKIRKEESLAFIDSFIILNKALLNKKKYIVGISITVDGKQIIYKAEDVEFVNVIKV